jgi:hypothetical protein
MGFCNVTESCRIENGQITCKDKCDLFNEAYTKCEKDDPRLPPIYVKGKCAFSEDNEPYCDCGSSPGDILKNFWDEKECVSTAFIVGMASVGAGFIIVVLLGVVIGLAVSNSGKSDKIKALE